MYRDQIGKRTSPFDSASKITPPRELSVRLHVYFAVNHDGTSKPKPKHKPKPKPKPKFQNSVLRCRTKFGFFSNKFGLAALKE